MLRDLVEDMEHKRVQFEDQIEHKLSQREIDCQGHVSELQVSDENLTDNVWRYILSCGYNSCVHVVSALYRSVFIERIHGQRPRRTPQSA